MIGKAKAQALICRLLSGLGCFAAVATVAIGLAPGTESPVGLPSLAVNAAVAAETLSLKDMRLYGQAFVAANAKKWDKARAIAARGKNPLPRKVLHWLALRRAKTAKFSELTAFIGGNPEWPRLASLRRRAERSIPAGYEHGEVLAWFDRHEPLTPVGMVRFVEALEDAGRNTEAHDLVRKAWLMRPRSFSNSAWCSSSPGVPSRIHTRAGFRGFSAAGASS